MQMPAEYIQSKGLEYKAKSGQIVLKTCPACGDEKWHCYVDPGEGGPWFCHKCQGKGNLWRLMQLMGDEPQRRTGSERPVSDTIRPAFGKPKFKTPDPQQADRYHQALLKDSAAVEHLTGRGIQKESIERFKIGLYANNGTRMVTIPHYQGGKLQNIKFRSLPPAEKTFRRIPDCKSILFNVDALKGQNEAFVAEGEIDAITLVQAGIKGVVAGTAGAGSFDPEWIDQLKPLKKIYIVYDADEAGQKGAQSLAKRLGYNRCFNVQLPEGQDVNDFFTSGGTPTAFKKLTREARPFDLPGVISTETAIALLQREISSDSAHTGLKTPWRSINTIIKSFRSGDLIILSAPPKIGKTTFALNIVTEYALDNVPALFYCLEMRAERLIKKVLQAQCKREELTRQDLQDASQNLAGLPLYFAHAYKKQSLEDVLSLIREAIKRYDLKFIVFDNLHFLIRSISNVNEELGQAVQGFKLLAEEMEIPIMAIAQPRKRDSSSKDEIMRADDIKYSNSVHADCDIMIILHRKRVASKAAEVDPQIFVAKTESLDPITLVRVEAHRYGPGGEALLYFHGDYSRFDELQTNNP